MRSVFLPLALVAACSDDGSNATGTETGSSTGDTPSMTTPTVEPDTGTTLPPPPDDDTIGETSDSTADSTGPASVCGDATVEGAEQCDDGNRQNGDACYADCTAPFELAWTVSLHNLINDLGIDAVTDDAGNVYVAGVIDVAQGETDVWIQQITADGRAGWSYTYDGMAQGDDRGTALAWLGTDLVVVGSVESETGIDAVVVRVDPTDQSTVWAIEIDGPSEIEDEDRFSAVAVDADGNIVVAGRVGADDEGLDLWIAMLDGDGNTLWEDTLLGGTADRGAVDLAVDGDGNVHVIGFDTVLNNQQIGWYGVWDSAGNLLTEETLGYSARSLALDPASGTMAIVGSVAAGDMTNSVLHVYDASFTEQWSVTQDVPANDAFNGVALGPAGDVYVAGFTLFTGEQENWWVGRFSATGDPLWSDTYNNRLDIIDVARAITLDPEGNPIAIGQENVLGEATNLFARKYIEGPTPR